MWRRRVLKAAVGLIAVGLIGWWIVEKAGPQLPPVAPRLLATGQMPASLAGWTGAIPPTVYAAVPTSDVSTPCGVRLGPQEAMGIGAPVIDSGLANIGGNVDGVSQFYREFAAHFRPGGAASRLDDIRTLAHHCTDFADDTAPNRTGSVTLTELPGYGDEAVLLRRWVSGQPQSGVFQSGDWVYAGSDALIVRSGDYLVEVSTEQNQTDPQTSPDTLLMLTRAALERFGS
jgi:hypothetical protein